MTLSNGRFVNWLTDGAPTIPWIVPKETIDIIPTKIRETEPFRQVPLVINRNLDLVDLFAGQARIAKWAAAGGLKRHRHGLRVW